MLNGIWEWKWEIIHERKGEKICEKNQRLNHEVVIWPHYYNLIVKV